MIQKQLAAAMLSVAVALCAASNAAAAPETSAPCVSARHAILIDATTGETLYEKAADEEALIASTTKIMTGLLICEVCDLSQEFRVPKEAVGIEGSSMYLKEGEVLHVQDLLYGMMLQSGNDAAVALAIACDGSVERFVERMNARAQELGLEGTQYANPNGLDHAENHSTARDLAALTRCALQNEAFYRTVSTKTVHIGNRVISNHNKLLWRYPGAIGVKTGFTKAAGRILVGAAERNGRRLISVTIYAPNDWSDHVKLFDYGFSGLEERQLVRAGAVVAEVEILSGEKKTAPLVAQTDVRFYLRPQETIRLKLLRPAFAYAPVACGQYAGEAAVMLGDTQIARVSLSWGQSVAQSGEK